MEATIVLNNDKFELSHFQTRKKVILKCLQFSSDLNLSVRVVLVSYFLFMLRIYDLKYERTENFKVNNIAYHININYRTGIEDVVNLKLHFILFRSLKNKIKSIFIASAIK